MGGTAPRPVARVWRMTGGELDDRSVTEAICAAFVPLLEATPGYLGVVVVVDRERRVLRGVSFWDGEESRDGSRPAVLAAVGETRKLSPVEFEGPWDYEVAYSRFRGPVTPPPGAGEQPPMLVRVGQIEGGDPADPGLVEVMKRYAATVVAPSPGCVGTLLLVDRDRPEVLGAALWADAVAAHRMDRAGDVAVQALAEGAGSVSFSRHGYEVLVSRPMTQLVD